MVLDQGLTRKLLLALQETQKSLNYGDSILVQPAYDGVRNPITISGYDWSEIDFHLKLLVERGLVDTGIETGGPQIGIHFSGLTEAGRRRAIGLNI